MAANTSNIQVRVDTKLKKEAEKLFESMGLDIQTAFRMFLKKSVSVKTIPFKLGEELDENGFTKKDRRELNKAIKEMENPKNWAGPFDNAEDLIKSLKPRTNK